jgi:hypothetical protein
MTETKNQRKARLKQEREAKALVDSENEYISPIVEELGYQTRPIGEGVEFYLDEDNDRLLLDIDVGTRRNITQSGKSIKIATATHMIKGLMKLSLNIFDKDMNDSELDDLVIFLKNKKRRDELDKQRKAME